MPIKKDAAGKRWVEMELLLPGTPEQVWHAMATGPGNTAWFVRGEIEPRVGGVLRLDFGEGAVTQGEVTAWEPPHRFGYVEHDWEPGAPSVATEITITARSGDRCVMRMVHSLFTTSDDWDDQVEGFESGWPGFFAILRAYLQHFPGQKAGSFLAFAPTAVDGLSAWKRLTTQLGLDGANVGEHRTTDGGPERLAGVIEHVHQDAQQRYVLLRLEAPSPGLILVGTSGPSVSPSEMELKVRQGGSSNVSVARYFYGAESPARAAESEARWRKWLAETFGGSSSDGAAPSTT